MMPGPPQPSPSPDEAAHVCANASARGCENTTCAQALAHTAACKLQEQEQQVLGCAHTQPGGDGGGGDRGGGGGACGGGGEGDAGGGNVVGCPVAAATAVAARGQRYRALVVQTAADSLLTAC